MLDDKKYIRIFIGSPGDVDAEREIACKAISDVEEILKIFKDHYPDISIPPLRAIGWEQVPSRVGLPNEIILERFPIEESDIFIFVLWKRFGSPPGTRRGDGSKYSSGTEEEFDKAYFQNRRNKTGRPFIMVYQKKDEFSIANLKPKEIGQYRKVVEFIENCQPNEKHPVLTRSFLSKDFEGLLRKNLLDTILNLSVLKEDNQKIKKEEAKPSLAEINQAPDSEEHPALLDWLAKNNLSTNPFKHQSAEYEKDLVKYYVPFKGFPLISSEIIQSNKNWLFFGVEGSGKTALKQFVLSRCAPSRASKTLAIPYEMNDLLETLSQSSDVNEILLYVSQQVLNSALSITNIRSKDEFGIRNLKEPALVFLRLGKLLEETQGYERTLCLLDLVPEISEDSLSKMIEVLARLVAHPADKVGFRLFLPKSLQRRFMRQDKYLGKCALREIRWDDKDLKELIKQRMIFYSINKANPYRALALLCEPKGKMRSIDDEIVKFAEGNPRAVIWLANQLFLEHCQNEPVSLKIGSQSWDKVQLDWWTTGRNLILGPSGRTETFSTSGTEVYFRNNDKPLKLSKRSKLLFRPLVEADGQTCSKEALIRSAWPEVHSDGVTNSALREAMRRLKVELEKKNDIDPAWVKTAHGQGYQLLEPEGNIAIGGNATNSVIVTGDHNRINLRVERRTNKEDA